VPPPATVAEGAASALEPAARDGMYDAAPEMTIDPSKFYYATLKTDKGDMKVQLFADRAPLAVNNFVFLAREGFYNDTTFHRVLEGFMAQGGDPTGTGMGGPGYAFANEVFPGASFDRPGLLAMANSGPDTNGSQFFITFGPADWLNGGYSLFGEVVEGQDVLNKLTRRDPETNPDFPGDKLYTVIVEESDTSALPTPTPLPPTPTPYAPSSVSPTDRPLAAVAPEEKANRFNTAPEMTIDPAKTYTATIATSQGDLVVALNAQDAPTAVNNFVTLADLGFYDNTRVNDVSPGEVIVIGAPTNDPAIDVGYTFQPEVGLPISPTTGSLAFISLNREADGSITASGSQLLIAVSEPPAQVNESYGFFGQIVQGVEVLPSLTVSDTISTITIESK
jgi:cyclophilin family peptidyl-prolyl cis-trans isomerase